MKQANNRNLLIIILSFVGMYAGNYFIEDQVNLAFYDFNWSDMIEGSVVFGLFVILLIPSVISVTKKVHDRFIKRQKEQTLNRSRVYLFIASILTAYSFIYFDLKYYYYILSLVFLVFFYYILLALYDKRYVEDANKSTLAVDDTLVNDLLRLLGTESNIKQVSYEYNRLKVELNDVKLVDLEGIKELGATGLFVAGNKVQAIIGTNANELETALKNYLQK